MAHKTGALKTRDLERVVVDTTVQPKAIAPPTGARLCHRALEKLVDLARRHDVRLQGVRSLGQRAAGSSSMPRRSTGQPVRRPHLGAGRRRAGGAHRGRDRCHNRPERFRVWTTGQVRRVTRPIRREMKRRAAVEPVIGHLKAEHRMGRNHLKGRSSDRSNTVLAAAGYNFALLLRWLGRLLRTLFHALCAVPQPRQTA